MKKTLIGIFLMTAFLTGCANQVVSEPELTTEALMELDVTEKLVDLYLPKQIDYSKLEPADGIYIGAYVEDNIELDHSMTQFEQVTGQKHAIRVMQYRTASDVTSRQMLECLADKQVPYIKVLPTKDYDINPIYHMISDIKTRYSMPVFIELYPVDSSVKDPSNYKNYYERAYKLIKRYLPESVVVWSISADSVYDCMTYYPGDHMVDWVGLNVYIPRYQNGKRYEFSLGDGLDFWYKNFQTSKPMMLSGIAVSHFSRVDHTYKVGEATETLNYFYDTIPKIYPRIKGMLYIDVDMKEVASSGKDDYRISSQAELVNAYHGLLQSDRFLHEVEEETPVSGTEQMKYTVPVLQIEDEKYIEKGYVRTLFNTIDTRGVPYIDYLDGNRYFSIENLLETYNMQF